jgi:hypothetical protein
MRVFKAIASRLDQSGDMMRTTGVDLSGANLAIETRLRNAQWRCLFCRSGKECRIWIEGGSGTVPNFCANRDFYRAHARHLPALPATELPIF